MATKATYDGTTGEFILNGAKHWITNAPIADVCVVWARLDGVGEGLYCGARYAWPEHAENSRKVLVAGLADRFYCHGGLPNT